MSYLDPTDWKAFKRSTHAMLDTMLDYLETVGERPVWQTVPPDVRAALDEPVPTAPTDLDTVYNRFRHEILPYPTGNIHPRFWGWVMGTGTPVAMVADMLASGMNAHAAGYDQASTLVERQILRWWTDIMGFPPTASGLLVSGGTVANLVGLTVARNTAADVREHGLRDHRLTVYASTETHSWIVRCCELLGLGRASLRRIPVDPDYRIDTGALAAAIQDDIDTGHRPACVVGNAGTVNTGAVDDLAALSAICRQHGVWLHVDGAFGALARLSPSRRHVLNGMELADSLAFDLHKWGYLPYEAGCVLVRDGDQHRAAMSNHTAAYLEPPGRGIQPDTLEYADLGIQLSRGFRALKVWMSLQVQGLDAWSRQIEDNIRQIEHLVHGIESHPELELLAPAPLNIVCFRYGHDNAVNREILLRLQETGVAVVSSTVLDGRFALRVAHTNHRTTDADFDVLIDAVVAIGRRVAAHTPAG